MMCPELVACSTANQVAVDMVSSSLLFFFSGTTQQIGFCRDGKRNFLASNWKLHTHVRSRKAFAANASTNSHRTWHDPSLSTLCGGYFTAPLSFELGKGEVIRGWDYAVSTMQKGERAILTVGPNYGYGERATGPIPPNSTLTFEMEVMGWEQQPVIKMYQWAGLVFMIGIVIYVLFVDDEDDILRKSLESSNSNEL